MDMVSLFRDAANIVQMRFAPAGHYRYAAPVTAAALLAIGAAQAAAMTPVFGNNAAILAFGILFGALRWLVLTRSVSAVLHYFGSPRLPLYGYTLAGELLVVPSIAVFYFPEAAAVGQIWLVWTFWAQAFGFARLGQQSLLKVLAGYLLSWLVLAAAGAALFGAFAAAGWLDWEQIQQNLNAALQQAR